MEQQEKNRTMFYKQVIALVLPMALQNLINVGVTSADVIMLGKVGETALSASSLAGQVQFIMTLIFFGLTSGAMVLTAQYWGKQDFAAIEQVLGIAFRFSSVVSVLFASAAFFFPRQVMFLFTKEMPVIQAGERYLKVVAVSYLFMAFTMVYLNIMRSIERVLISTIVYSISFCVNVIGNAIFIFGLFGAPRLGIVGAALATTIARGVELILTACYGKWRNKEIRIRISAIFAKNPLLYRDFLTYAMPVMLNELMWGSGVSVITAILGHLGSPVVAANAVAQVARQLATVVSFGLASAAAVMIGKAIGAHEEQRAQQYASRFIKLSVIAGAVGAICILGILPMLLSNLHLTQEAKQNLIVMMLIMSYFVVAQAYNTTMIVGIFRGGGDTKFGLFVDVSTMWGGSILCGALAAFVFHAPLVLVYMILLSDEILKLPLTTLRYKRKRWVKNVTR